ncbi:hypothetical protein HK098_002114 [Nowakowskiella sp. JEL0407]|nr:hypothetical protein HK098_002114 [Nowakowskiella sp. JEL0407]
MRGVSLTRLTAESRQSYGIKEGHWDSLVHAVEKLQNSLLTNQIPLNSQHVPDSNAFSTGTPATSTPGTPKLAEYDVRYAYLFHFSSWAHQDEVFKIRDALRSRGFTVWIDVEQIADDIYDAMRKAILRSKVIVPCLTQEYEASANCKRELYYAAGLKTPPKRIVPIRLRNCSLTWAEFLTSGKYHISIDLSNMSTSEWEAKIDELERECNFDNFNKPHGIKGMA